MTAEQEFEWELKVFRTEAEEAAQFFYSYLAMHDIAKHNKTVFRMFDKHAFFWNTVLGALQTAAVIALGRIFDQDSPHNVDRVLRVAQQHREIFSKVALGKRKQGASSQSPSWLPDYLAKVYVPTPTDFRRLRRHVKQRRRSYENNYRDLRNQYYAHKQTADSATVARLVAKTNIREMQRLFTFLLRLHQALQELFANGTKPRLRPMRYSAQRIMQRPSSHVPSDSVHEHIMSEAEQALLGVAQRPRRSS